MPTTPEAVLLTCAEGGSRAGGFTQAACFLLAPSHHLPSEPWHIGQSARIVSVGGRITPEDRAVGFQEPDASLSRANLNPTERTEMGRD